MGQSHGLCTDLGTGRAQSGIGTLIILIAMLLVATIAAGVFFDITGSLQADVDESSEESAASVITRLSVINVIGTDRRGDSLRAVKVTVKSASQSENIDLGKTVAQWVGPTGATDLTLGETADNTKFSLVAAQDADGSLEQGVLNAPSDRATLRFDAAAISGSGLSPGERVTIQLTTPTGGTTTVNIIVPDQLLGGSSIAL